MQYSHSMHAAVACLLLLGLAACRGHVEGTAYPPPRSDDLSDGRPLFSDTGPSASDASPSTEPALRPKPLKSACAVAGECESGHCADGVCCDRSCDGSCERCDVKDHEGTCTPDPGQCLSLGYSSTQGMHGWHYQYFDGSTHRDMTWQEGFGGSWRGSTEDCLIGRGWAHPHAPCEPVITWKAPRSGSVTVQGQMDRYDARGDGVKTRVLKNGAQVWPSSGWQMLHPRLMAQHLFLVDVAAGDTLRFHVDQNGDNGFDTVEWSPVIRYGAPPAFTLDKLERVADPADFSDFHVDSNLSTIRRGADLLWHHSWGGLGTPGKHLRTRGPLDDPFQTKVFEKNNQAFFTNPNGLDASWGWWVQNIYQISNDELIGLCHLERAGTPHVVYRVGLAYSSDGGATFAKLGYIVRQHVEQEAVDANIQGVPYLLEEGHLYVYFNDYDGQRSYVATARAPRDDVLAAARNGTVSPWSKYHQGGWSEQGLGGASTDLLSSSPFGACTVKSHGDAASSSLKGIHVLSANVEWCEHRGIWISFASDPVSWTRPVWIQDISDRQEAFAQYVSIVNADGTDNSAVGAQLFLYWGFAPRWKEEGFASLKNIYRQRVALR